MDILQLIVSGLANGCVYGLIALGFVAAFLLPSASAMIGYTVGAIFFGLSLLAQRGARLFMAGRVQRLGANP